MIVFKVAKQQAIEAIMTGCYNSEEREAGKNLLEDGSLSELEAIEIIKSVLGHQATCSEHHFLAGVEVWVFKPVSGWYVKFFILDGVTFVSFHK